MGCEEVAALARDVYELRVAEVDHLTVQLASAASPEEATAARARIRELEITLPDLAATVIGLTAPHDDEPPEREQRTVERLRRWLPGSDA